VHLFLEKLLLPALLVITAFPTLCAGTLGVNIVAMFPKGTAEFAYADLKEARKFPWYPQFKSQALPVRVSDLEHFLASVGVDDNLRINEVAWALGSGETASGREDKSVPDSDKVLGVALGNFRSGIGQKLPESAQGSRLRLSRVHPISMRVM
jgi:hypothetical protein